ncbi:hypothetical protein EC968_002097 [Mortierella alpina]|nr:hypothetical protein EC968_002097 [Mortierella alpina]
MDSKKRPNEDQPGSEKVQPTTSTPINAELPASDSLGPVESMAVDATTSHPPEALSGAPSVSTEAMIVESGIAPSEANKRIKLTMESDHRGANYSPSLDVADPSKETKGLAEWVGQMDKVDATKVAEPSSQKEADLGVSDSSSLQERHTIDATHSTEAPVASQDQLPQKHLENATSAAAGPESSQDLVQALLEPQTGATATNPSDSILAVASLSEPLKTTLETMELDSQPPAEAQVQQEDRSTLTVNSQLSSTMPPQPSTNSHGAVEPKPNEHEAKSSGISVSDEQTQSQEVEPSVSKPADSKPSDVAQVPEETKLSSEGNHDNLNAMDIDPPQGSAQDSGPSLDQSSGAEIAKVTVDVTTGDSNGSVRMTVPQPATDDSDRLENSNTPGGGKPASAPEISNSLHTEKQPSVAKDSTLSQEPTTSSSVSAPITPASASVPASHTEAPIQNLAPKKAPSQHDLPPLSALASPTLQSARQSRSTMSVSALLVNNDDDSQRGQESAKHQSRGMFTPYDHSPRPTHSSTLPAPLPPVQEPPSTRPAPPASSPLQQPMRPITAPINVARGHDPADGPSARQGHAGFDRDFVDHHHHHSGRSQDPMPPYGASRGSQIKEYPADEVMESGGVSGYAPQRHRVMSPAGIRPLQESVNGLGASGPMNGKLSGLGPVASNASTHEHDPHGHHAAHYRSDAGPAASGGRSSAYAPSSHAGLTHSSAANGHGAPFTSSIHTTMRTSGPTATPLTSSQALPPAASVPESRHPRLIVKNDPSLKVDGLPELFLGYHRYDPGVLMPAVQGKENSLLEVRVASSYLTYDNYKVKKREVWGTDVYTDDSDIVAMLIHSGYYIPPISPHSSEQDSLQPTTLHHNFVPNPLKHICPEYDLAVTLRVMPKLLKYQGSIRNRIKSRTWNTGHDGVSLRIESIRKLSAGEALNRGRSQCKRRMKEYGQERLRVLSNIHDETTESVQNERAMRTATFEFTHQGDPCFKYSPELVMDRHDGLSRKWTSWRLKKEVLIVENDEERYEISLQHQAGTDARRFDQYRFAVISPRTSLSSWSRASYPLESNDISEVLYEDLDWQDFEWVDRGVVVQPAVRRQNARQDGSHSSSAMEGVTTTDPKDDTAMDSSKEGERVKATAAKATPGAISTDVARLTRADSALPESRQDGVFCVVSRLFWRPMTEKRAPKSSAPEITSPTGSNALKEPQPQAGSDAQDYSLPQAPDAAVSLPANEPVPQQQGASARSNPQDQVPIGTGVEADSEVTKTVIMPATVPVAISASSPSSGPTSKQETHAQATATVSSTPASVPGSANVDGAGSRSLTLPQQQSSETKNPEREVQGQSLTSPTPSTGPVEREEGELEEGEIASD